MKKYNLLPSASHFLPFTYGKSCLHFSYTNSKMYCKMEFDIGDEIHQTVVSRPIDKDAIAKLDLLSSDNYIDPMYVFNGLNGETGIVDRLNELHNNLTTLEHPSSTANRHFSGIWRVGTLRINNLGVLF